MIEKLKRSYHKHDWKFIRVLDNPLVMPDYRVRVTEKCKACSKDRIRKATELEIATEINRIQCEICGELRSIHETDDHLPSCIKALAKKINNLDERLSSARIEI